MAPPKREPRAAKRAFTVLELLMVVGVLAVLLAILLPAIKTVHTAALKRRAAIQATALAQAAIRYKTEYGFWPGQLETQADLSVAIRAPFRTDAWTPVIIARERGSSFSVTAQGAEPLYIEDADVYRAFRRVGPPDGASLLPNPLNPRGIRFLDLENESDPEHVQFRDPWGRGFVLFMGLNPKSAFTHTVTFPDGRTQQVRVENAIAFAFSYGPDGTRSANFIYSAGVRP